MNLNRIQNATIGGELTQLYYELGATEKAKTLKCELKHRLTEELNYYYTIKPSRQRFIAYEIKPREEALQLIENLTL